MLDSVCFCLAVRKCHVDHSAVGYKRRLCPASHRHALIISHSLFSTGYKESRTKDELVVEKEWALPWYY